jgi:hypothetical protein
MSDKRPETHACEGCGTASACKSINLINGHLWLCKLCLDELNCKNPELATIRAKLALLLAGEIVECPTTDKHGFDIQGPDVGADLSKIGMSCECHWRSDVHGNVCPEHGKTGRPITHRIPLDVASMSTVEMVERVAKRLVEAERSADLNIRHADALEAGREQDERLLEIAEKRVEQLEAELNQLRTQHANPVRS